MIKQKQNQLPSALNLEVDALSKIFQHTTNSYKFVFFLALLELLKLHCFNSKRVFSYNEITIEMLVIAWFPYKFFGLSFGAQDTITQKIDKLELCFSTSIDFFGRDRPNLRKALQKTDLKEAARLMDFVPYRLIIPFLEPQLQLIDKGSWMLFERAMPSITNVNFERARPLYCFDSDDYNKCESIQWHSDWVSYFERHFQAIETWAKSCWLEYMQRRNQDKIVLYETLFPSINN
ncbi:hypothetical protein SAMN05421644_1617 [Allochromatium warmingii]|uniref:Uncharacterized protein n=1 Tax=Allochromatium warmingii TaxID=61595 RepID=A0A1H3JLP2_ALLWA|nr:hypothetical protein [Allochromatium warmingii]SDY40831.1 hypothetical protein SAMN05421644_1617 [Allochromatium warmingii]